jgi:transporter family-2 protein
MSVSPAAAPPVHSRAVLAAGVAGAVVIGVLTAIQSRINGELARGLDDGYLGAVISFGSGFIILLIALALWKPGRTGLRTVFASVAARRTPWWYLAGGAGGALFVLAQGISGAVLGVALFSIAIVCGQTISGLLIDRTGIGTTRPAAITVTRLVGSVLALAAVTLAVSTQFAGNIPPWLLILPFISGLAISGQQAVNGQVRGVSGSALTATFMNFLVGVILLLIICIVHELIVGLPGGLPTNPILYIGGLVGVIFIGGTVFVVRITGVLLLALGSVAGQLVTSLALDLIVPIPGHVVAATTVAGTLLTIVAVAIAAIPSRAMPVRAR